LRTNDQDENNLQFNFYDVFDEQKGRGFQERNGDCEDRDLQFLFRELKVINI